MKTYIAYGYTNISICLNIYIHMVCAYIYIWYIHVYIYIYTSTVLHGEAKDSSFSGPKNCGSYCCCAAPRMQTPRPNSTGKCTIKNMQKAQAIERQSCQTLFYQEYPHEARQKSPWGYTTTPFSTIEFARALHQLGPCVRPLCESGALFQMSYYMYVYIYICITICI